MPYPRFVALICYWLTWFVPLGGYGVYEAFYGPQYGHGFEYGVGGAKLSLIVVAILATISSPGAIAALLLLGKIEPASAWRLIGFTVLGALVPLLMIVVIELTPSAWHVSLPWLYVYIPVYLAILILPITTILGAAKWGCIERLRIQGVCSACGYDLRGTTGPQCPECGSTIASATTPNT